MARPIPLDAEIECMARDADEDITRTRVALHGNIPIDAIPERVKLTDEIAPESVIEVIYDRLSERYVVCGRFWQTLYVRYDEKDEWEDALQLAITVAVREEWPLQSQVYAWDHVDTAEVGADRIPRPWLEDTH